MVLPFIAVGDGRMSSNLVVVLNVPLKNGVFLKSNMEVKPNESFFFFRQTSKTVYFAKRTKQDGS